MGSCTLILIYSLMLLSVCRFIRQAASVSHILCFSIDRLCSDDSLNVYVPRAEVMLWVIGLALVPIDAFLIGTCAGTASLASRKLGGKLFF